VASSRADGGGGRGGIGSQGRVGSSRGPWGLRWLSIKGDGRVASWAISGVGKGGVAGAGGRGRVGDGQWPQAARCHG
jgi:hypothetical protein